MAELVDALGSGSSWCKPVGVQVPFRVLNSCKIENGRCSGYEFNLPSNIFHLPSLRGYSLAGKASRSQREDQGFESP